MPEKTFVQFDDYRDARQRLDAALGPLERPGTQPDQLKEAIAAYLAYLELIDRAFPMLLAVGEPLTLQRAPSGTYLLPPIAGTPLRYLVSLFPRTPSQPAGLRLFEWRPGLENGDQRLQDFGGPSAQPGAAQRETKVDFPDCAMAELPSRILAPVLTPTMAVFTLAYRTGTLTVMANAQPGPAGPQIQVTWSPQPESKGLARAERVSGGDMPVGVFIQRRTGGEDWPDDELLDPDQNPVPLDKPKVGRIDGVDGPLAPPLRYLASNLARVFRVDLKTGEVRQSARLGGKVEDILVVERPEPDRERAVLAACYDGRVYWLEDDEKEECLRILHWHPMPRLHIQRMVGDTKGNIIALDQYYRLHPLRLNQASEVKILRDRATESITRCLDKEPGRLHRYLVEENGLAAGADPDPERFRLLVEVWLRAIQGSDWAAATRDYLDEVARDLARAFTADTPSERSLRIARCHERLLQRVWGWMRNQIDSRRHKPILEPQKVLNTIVALCDLADEAPDRLWYKVLREHDWLEPWGEATPIEDRTRIVKQEYYQQALDRLRRTVDRQRRLMAARSYPLRPLTVVSSLRLRGQARHLRCLNHAKQSFVGFVPSRGLSVFAHTKQPVPRWVLQDHLDGIKAGLWKGQIGAIATRVNTQDAKDQTDLLLATTNQGEGLLFEVRDGKLHLLQCASVPVDCYSARYLRLERSAGGPRRGFLLGGNDPRERACLVWLGLDLHDSQPRLGSPRVLWQSDERGRLRLIKEDPPRAPRTSSGEPRIWGIDQVRNLLLCWSLEPLVSAANPPGTLAEPIVWYRSVTELHALYVSTLGPPQVVCGGHDGSVVALSRQPGQEGRLLWSVGCGSAIRRIRRIATGPRQTGESEHGFWLAAGDSDDSMLLDDQGRLMGALERVGPVSATCRLETGKAVIAAQSGRLLFLDGGSPAAVQDRWGIGSIEVYPLRAPERADQWPAIEVMADLFNSDEPLISQKGLRLIAQALVHGTLTEDQIVALETLTRPSGDDALEAAPNRRYPPHRAALLARRPDFPGQAPSPPCPYPGQLLRRLWDGLAKRVDSDVLSQVVDGILSVSEPATLAGDSHARELTEQIGRCLWDEPPGGDCPPRIAVGDQLRLLRLGQAARAWQTACGLEPTRPTPCWAETLARLWGTDDPEVLGQRFKWLAHSRLPFHGFGSGHRDRDREPWLDLLGFHDEPGALAALGLAALRAYPEDAVLTPAEVDRLIAVFPANTHWRQWLSGLAELIRQVRNARDLNGHHVAWQEREYLLSLRSQVDGAEAVLRAENRLTLAGVFWRRYRGDWSKAIAARLQALDEGMAGTGLANYLEVGTRFTWQDARRVEVQLSVHNRATRSLFVLRIMGVDGAFPEVKRGQPLPASKDPTEIAFGIGTQIDDELDESVTLYCQDQLGRDYEHRIPLKSSRSLETFRDDPWWPARARELMARLDQRQPLLWLCGPWWPETEHERLARLVQDRYADAWASVAHIGGLVQAEIADTPIWIPDLDPTGEGPRLVIQVHDLLHQDKGPGISRHALAAWVHLRGDTPAPVTAALGDWIPGRQTIQSLLGRCLCDDQYSKLVTGIRDQPAASLTAWCTGTPLDDPGGAAHQGLGDLGLDLWRRLLGDGVPLADLSHWLDCTPDRLDEIRVAIRRVDALLAPGLAALTGTEIRSMVAPLLGVLTQSEPGLAGTICYAQTSGDRDKRIDLLHQTLSRVYCLLPGQAPAVDQAGLAGGFWLLVNRGPVADLPGIALRLEPDDLLALLCARDRRHALRRLNQLAAVQHRITPGRVFQTKPGLDAERMDRAFHGRGKELEYIRELLDLHVEDQTAERPIGAAPLPKSAGVLLVGGRRMGKTTLMRRIEHELRLRNDKRPRMELVCLGVPNFEGDALLRWFLGRLWDGLKVPGQDDRYDWSDSYNQRQRNEILTRFKQRLEQISRRRQHKAVLFLDETYHLLERDAQHHVVGNLIRELIQANLITVIATTYPHGTAGSEGLYWLAVTASPTNPWYNLFGRPLFLEPWSPKETWEFLQTRLDGFGILLPESLAGAVLHSCRGFPWIAHSLGLALCDTANGRRRVISAGDWERALGITREEVLRHLRATVRAIAEQADKENGTDPDADPQQAFGLGRLWDALSILAQAGEMLPIKPHDGSWPDELVVDTEAVAAHFKNRIPIQRVRKALDQLTHTGVLVGTEDERFRFCNNLFPAYVRPKERR